jgi:succinate dehydrogenase/fumarate reductase cytochrome b subunit
MDQHFVFTPTVKESEQALRAISRSMATQIQRPLVRILSCLAIYVLPLGFAAMFFRDSFGEIYLTFFLFVVILVAASRFGPSTASGIASRIAVPQEVQFGSEEITQETDRAKTTWYWASLNRLHVLNELIVLEFRDWSWLPIPNRLWVDADSKERFLERLRTLRPDVAPSLATSAVPSPFTLINVGAAFAAAELFLLQIFGATAALFSPSAWPEALQYARQNGPEALGALFAAALSIAMLGFFGVRYALRRLQRSHPRAANCIAATFPVIFGALVIASVVYRPCGC